MPRTNNCRLAPHHGAAKTGDGDGDKDDGSNEVFHSAHSSPMSSDDLRSNHTSSDTGGSDCALCCRAGAARPPATTPVAPSDTVTVSTSDSMPSAPSAASLNNLVFEDEARDELMQSYHRRRRVAAAAAQTDRHRHQTHCQQHQHQHHHHHHRGQHDQQRHRGHDPQSQHSQRPEGGDQRLQRARCQHHTRRHLRRAQMLRQRSARLPRPSSSSSSGSGDDAPSKTDVNFKRAPGAARPIKEAGSNSVNKAAGSNPRHARQQPPTQLSTRPRLAAPTCAATTTTTTTATSSASTCQRSAGATDSAVCSIVRSLEANSLSNRLTYAKKLGSQQPQRDSAASAAPMPSVAETALTGGSGDAVRTLRTRSQDILRDESVPLTITIDTNVPEITRLVALNLSAAEWCQSENICHLGAFGHDFSSSPSPSAPRAPTATCPKLCTLKHPISSRNTPPVRYPTQVYTPQIRATKTILYDRHYNDRIFYNTPISMADDMGFHSMPVKVLSFVYMDYSVNRKMLLRILKNIARAQNIVTIVNANHINLGMYRLKVGNCPNSSVAAVIGSLITAYQVERRLLHPQEMETVMCYDGSPKPVADILDHLAPLSCKYGSRECRGCAVHNKPPQQAQQRQPPLPPALPSSSSSSSPSSAVAAAQQSGSSAQPRVLKKTTTITTVTEEAGATGGARPEPPSGLHDKVPISDCMHYNIYTMLENRPLKRHIVDDCSVCRV